VVAALFRAPLTASLLLFELTRDYDVILPLMVSAGLGSVVADAIESVVEQDQVAELRRDRDSVSWGDLADKKSNATSASLVEEND
jgi:H+/Cl- antiporter ClcA